jgi:hypothetical protein
MTDVAPVSGNNAPQSIEGRAVALLPTPSRIDLKTIDDVRVEMARVYRDMRAARIDTQEGTRLCYVLAQLGKLIESGEIEKRLEALEGVLKHRRAR